MNDQTPSTLPSTQTAEMALLQSPAARAMRKVPRILIKRLIPLTLIGIAAVAVAVVTAMTFGASTYHITSRLVYTPLPTAGVRDLYEPPDLKTLLTMVKSAETLAQLREEFHLVEPVQLIDQLVEAKNPSQTNTIDLSLDWGDAEQGRQVLNRLMAIYIDNVAAMRRDKLAGYVDDMEASLRLARRRRSSAVDALHAFNAEVAIDDFKTGPKEIADEIASFEEALNRAQIDEAKYISAFKDSTERLERMKREESEKAAKEAAEEDAQGSMTDLRHQQNRLREKLQAERFKAEIAAKIEVKRREVERETALYEQSLSTAAAVEMLRGQLMELYAQIAETPQIEELKKEIAHLDETIAPDSGKKKPKQSPIIYGLLMSNMQNEQDLLSTRSRIDFIKVELSMARRRAMKLSQLLDEGEALQADVDSIDRQLISIEEKRGAFEQMLGYEPHEFSITSPASHLLTPPSSNKKKLAIMVILAIGFLLAGPMLAWDFYRARQADGAILMRGFGLPTISPPLGSENLIGRRQALNSRRWCDQVSLRIQQLAPQSGSVVLLSHHNPSDLDAMLWYGTAGALAERDERVCVVLAQTEETSHAMFVHAMTQPGRTDPSPASRFTGLAEYLSEQTDAVDEIIVRSPRRNVDVITAGMSPLMTNRMATRRMDELFETLRPRYSIILLVGPEFADTLGVEITARQSDGVIVCGEQDAAFEAAEEYTLQSLFELNAPLWGHVVRPDKDPVLDAQAKGRLIEQAAAPEHLT